MLSALPCLRCSRLRSSRLCTSYCEPWCALVSPHLTLTLFTLRSPARGFLFFKFQVICGRSQCLLPPESPYTLKSLPPASASHTHSDWFFSPPNLSPRSFLPPLTPFQLPPPKKQLLCDLTTCQRSTQPPPFRRTKSGTKGQLR